MAMFSAICALTHCRVRTHCQVPFRLGGLLALGLYLALVPAAYAQMADTVLGVYPARISDGTVAVYGVVRQIPDHPLAEGTVLAVQITADDSEASTAARREAGEEPCPDCTATHYFLVREPGQARPKVLIHAPGPVTYIHVDGREYALGAIRLAWNDDGQPRLEHATLMQTGFVPPIFKRKIRIRFDAHPEPDPRADEIAKMALADMMETDRRAQEAYEKAVRDQLGPP